MSGMAAAGRAVILIGLALVVVGLLMALIGRAGLPGTVVLRRGHVIVAFPLLASLVLSVVLTVLLNLLFRAR